MQINPDLIDLAQIRLSDRQRWGNKASALGELRSRGFPVPDGVCLSIEAFRLAGADLHLTEPLAQALHAAAELLFSAHSALAVRSSAAEEDLPGASFAGLYQSVIGAADPEGIAAAVRAVWRSYASPLAVAARAGGNRDEPSAGMGVLIQAAIPAEVAGVCFSVDPVQPLCGRLVITACWGMGTGVVEGTIPADTLWLRREDLAVDERRIVEKPACFTLDPQVGLARGPVDEVRRRAACLPDEWARRIAQFAMAAEQVFGQPQDVEWAIAEGQIWILQSRSIASLDASQALIKYFFPVEWESSQDARRFWTRNRYERLGILPLYPLDIDVIRHLESMRIETCLFLGADRNQDLRVVNGQIYTSPAPLPVSSADLRVRRQAFLDLDQRLVREGRTAWDHWGPEIERANQRLTAVEAGELDGPGLAGFLEDALATRRRHYMLHPLTWFKPRRAYLEAFQAVSGLSGDEAETAAYRLLEGEETPLTRMIDGLYCLAEEARSLPVVAAWMRRAAEDPNSQGAGEMAGFPTSAPGAAGWFLRFKEFLDEYGDRNGDGYGSEALLTTPTWRDRPMQAVQLAARFLDSQVEPPSQQRERSRRAIETEVEALCAQCPQALAVEDFLQQLRFARRVQAVVEIHNHHIEQIGLGQLRRAVMAAAHWLQANGALSEADEIFWLTFSEILSALRQPEQEGLGDRIQKRKEEYREWMERQPPPFLGLPPAGLPSRATVADAVTPGELQTAGKIRGIGASAGVASGRARVIKSWEAAPQVMAGDILVAENAGPLWVPFFPVLAGIVLESGSLGQHAAATCREYGLPAVISAPNATHIIRDGEQISIDGVKGIVELSGHS